MKNKIIITLQVLLTMSTLFCNAQEQKLLYHEELTAEHEIHFSAQTKQVPIVGTLVSVDYSDGVFILRENRGTDQYGQTKTLWHIVDTTGTFLARNLNWDCMPYTLPVFNQGCAINHNCGLTIIDKSGKTVCDLSKTYDFTGDKFVDGLALAAGKQFREGSEAYYRISYIGTDGKVKFPNLTVKVSKWDVSREALQVAPVRDGLRRHYDFKTKKYGFINEQGVYVIQPEYTAAHDFSEGMAAVLMTTDDGDKWGFIGTDGKTLIAPIFRIEPGDFHDSLAVVTKNTGWKTIMLRDGRYYNIDLKAVLDYNGGFTYFITHDSKQFIADTKLKGIEVYASRHQINLFGMERLKAIRDTSTPLNFDKGGIYTHAIMPYLYPPYGTFEYFGDGFFWFESNSADNESGIIRADGERVMVFRKSEW